ncbi:NAD+ synthase [Methylocaldum szegediense]|uniref:Glutamine-dependent NAD(+) synthetase n=1 Tax=Methylocaldum szegediense TaxID=73780 RepID=A0ABM9I2G9_9GAMM|nr:NAD+ synthase [Methylocaldum szegediense]CAI8846205.1 Glutamine-dependent NAD(+) synthetase [Methylocaldum szegediense]
MNLRIAIAQLDFLVGDLRGNADRILQAAREARDRLRAHAVVFPELCLAGYPPEDLILRCDFLAQAERTLDDIASQVHGIDVIVGFPERRAGMPYNSAAVLREGKIHAVYRKHALPNYGVFDEKRYFLPGSEPCVFDLCGVPVGITICEDLWLPGAVEQAAEAGAKLILNINASPYHANKLKEREAVARERVVLTGVPLVYVNLIGGQDELVFDGASFVMNREGSVTFRAPEFEESLLPVDFVCGDRVEPVASDLAEPLPEIASVYKALVTGIRDYVSKNRFEGAVLGLSGGIDSALTLVLATDALGADQVECVLMPSRYTAAISVEDARLEAETLGCRYHIIPIEPAFDAFLGMLEESFAGMPPDTTEENIQARCRGIILMAFSNKKRKILLTTGNKSEMSVGYATLYGDMAGGFAPLKDVPKLLVYRLAEYRNSLSPIIPQRVIERAPSAELRPNQKDEDSLPPYSILDPILEMYVEQDKSVEDIAAAGFPEHEVVRVTRMVDSNEYKRRQAPPGVKITRRAFGRDRRYPITSGYRR